jgi:hypothetical protein
MCRIRGRDEGHGIENQQPRGIDPAPDRRSRAARPDPAVLRRAAAERGDGQTHRLTKPGAGQSAGRHHADMARIDYRDLPLSPRRAGHCARPESPCTEHRTCGDDTAEACPADGPGFWSLSTAIAAGTWFMYQGSCGRSSNANRVRWCCHPRLISTPNLSSKQSGELTMRVLAAGNRDYIGAVLVPVPAHGRAPGRRARRRPA